MSCLKNLEETGGFSNLIVTNQFKKRSGIVLFRNCSETQLFRKKLGNVWNRIV